MADQIEVSRVVFGPECVKVHGTLLAWHANSIGNCQNSSLSSVRPEVKPLGLGLWVFVAQHVARSAMDEVKPGARRAIDGLVLIFGRVITILQPVLDPLVGVGTGENDWAAHQAILGRPSLF
jgi:hypothetical protein